jgi:hypothetical protein
MSSITHPYAYQCPSHRALLTLMHNIDKPLLTLRFIAHNSYYVTLTYQTEISHIVERVFTEKALNVR